MLISQPEYRKNEPKDCCLLRRMLHELRLQAREWNSRVGHTTRGEGFFVSALSTYGPRLLRSIPPGARGTVKG